MTDHGPLDVLALSGPGEASNGWREARRKSKAADMQFRILDLESLIQVKEEAAQDKDRAVPTSCARLSENAQVGSPTATEEGPTSSPVAAWRTHCPPRPERIESRSKVMPKLPRTSFSMIDSVRLA